MHPACHPTFCRQWCGIDGGSHGCLGGVAVCRTPWPLVPALSIERWPFHISDDELKTIYQLARGRFKSELAPDQIRLGAYDRHGEYADDWLVHQVVDESGHRDALRDQLIYKVVAGQGRHSSGILTHEEFARWAKYEAYLNENYWQGVEPALVYTHASAA